MSEASPDESGSKSKDFICGVVEGFYGRPWTTEQRKDLFQKLKKWGLDMYVYAPKDDYKHRAYWREMYTVEEAEHLTSLITAAKDQGITFCYALSPGLDITYSSQKEITILKRKLEQVSQFGCTCFALLFDDIELEMSEADKQVFQSFAHAQVSVTNEIHQHLAYPRFLLCPTQYCASRAVPTVSSSEYLNTLGTKLALQIDVMWTGSKVITKTLTRESIEEITQVLRRPPVIWDNLHANDYDQKRIYLGPYCGRSPELIPLLRGVLTNPNCEYNANMIAIRTLAHWASCSMDAPQHSEAVSWDIKLERESEQGEDDTPLTLDKHVYHPRQALKLAINEWLPEFSIPKSSQAPIIKPQAVITVPPVPIIPIMPSVNTCMSLSSSTTTTTTTAEAPPAIPTVTTCQLRALAQVCSTHTVSQMETFNPIANPVMNSLVSPTKVILNESIPNPIIPSSIIPAELPVSTLPVPILGIKTLDENLEKIDQNMNDKGVELENADGIVVDDEQTRNGEMSVGGTPQTLSPNVVTAEESLDVDQSSAVADTDVPMNDAMSENGSMQVEPSHSPLSSDMMVEMNDANDSSDVPVEEPSSPIVDANSLTAADLLLLCDLCYLPFEHGPQGLALLNDYNWLTTRAHCILPKATKHESSEWRRRRARFAHQVSRVRRVCRRVSLAPHRELHAELAPHAHELCAACTLLHAAVSWTELGKFPANMAQNSQGSYTWFSKGWREAFESGAQEPWVFRGGLTADLRRLLPVECSGDLMRMQTVPTGLPLMIRPYTNADEEAVRMICHKTCRDGVDCSDLFPSDLQSLPADRLVEPFLTLHPEFCMVIENDEQCNQHDCESPNDDDDSDTEKPDKVDTANGVKPEILGYVCAALNSKEFYKRQEIAWIPEMCIKYPQELTQRDDLSQAAKECIRDFHTFASLERAPETLVRSHPALVSCCVLRQVADSDARRALTCLLYALRTHGVSGVHVCINGSDHYLRQLYGRLGFTETHRSDSDRLYLARAI